MFYTHYGQTYTVIVLVLQLQFVCRYCEKKQLVYYNNKKKNQNQYVLHQMVGVFLL